MSSNSKKVIHLEHLVDELIKTRPEESQIRHYMEAAGLRYESDPVSRMNTVLAALNNVQSTMRRKKERADEQGNGI